MMNSQFNSEAYANSIQHLKGIKPNCSYLTKMAMIRRFIIPDGILEYYYNTVPQSVANISNSLRGNYRLPLNPEVVKFKLGNGPALEMRQEDVNRFFEPYDYSVYGGYMCSRTLEVMNDAVIRHNIPLSTVEESFKAYGSGFTQGVETFVSNIAKEKSLFTGEDIGVVVFKYAVGIYPMQYRDGGVTMFNKTENGEYLPTDWHSWGIGEGQFYKAWLIILEAPDSFVNMFNDLKRSCVSRVYGMWERISEKKPEYEIFVRFALVKNCYELEAKLHRVYEEIATRPDTQEKAIALINSYYSELNALDRVKEFIAKWHPDESADPSIRIKTADAIKEYDDFTNNLPGLDSVQSSEDLESYSSIKAQKRQFVRLQNKIITQWDDKYLDRQGLTCSVIGWGKFVNHLITAKMMADKYVSNQKGKTTHAIVNEGGQDQETGEREILNAGSKSVLNDNTECRLPIETLKAASQTYKALYFYYMFLAGGVDIKSMDIAKRCCAELGITVSHNSLYQKYAKFKNSKAKNFVDGIDEAFPKALLELEQDCIINKLKQIATLIKSDLKIIQS